tara:strand:+ start:26 stop:418 length:393 start_codon:yes stop_codon:yes gene_type:complete
VKFFIKYTFFCIIAISINLTLQRLILNELSIKFIYIFALVAGTLGGLIVKYLLDKYFIFNSASTSLEKEFKKFSIYTVLGASTTLIFWFTETTFYLIYKTHFAREIGALIGLTVGYFIKYNLDRKFVFNN